MVYIHTLKLKAGHILFVFGFHLGKGLFTNTVEGIALHVFSTIGDHLT